MGDKVIQKSLEDFFETNNPEWEEIRVENLELQSFEKTNILSDIYFFDLLIKENSINRQFKLVLKLGLGINKSTAAVWASEKEVMTSMYECGYPVPRIFGFGESLIPDRGAFIVMEYIRGKNLSELIDENIDNTQALEGYITRYAELMVELHNLKCNGKTLKIGRNNEIYTSGHTNPMAASVEKYLKFTDHIKYETISTILNWLLSESKNLETPLELGITHGDFQTDNALVQENGKLCTIDWGFAKTADIRIDIHWSNLLNRFRHNERISEEIYKTYLKHQERELTDNPFFEVFSMVRLMVGLSELAFSSKNYHENINKLMRAMDMGYMGKRISDITGLTLRDLETDFRQVTGVTV
jgi:aminoglycoside phosphotransferase (APT) family kinase protein